MSLDLRYIVFFEWISDITLLIVFGLRDRLVGIALEDGMMVRGVVVRIVGVWGEEFWVGFVDILGVILLFSVRTVGEVKGIGVRGIILIFSTCLVIICKTVLFLIRFFDRYRYISLFFFDRLKMSKFFLFIRLYFGFSVLSLLFWNFYIIRVRLDFWEYLSFVVSSCLKKCCR